MHLAAVTEHFMTQSDPERDVGSSREAVGPRENRGLRGCRSHRKKKSENP